MTLLLRTALLAAVHAACSAPADESLESDAETPGTSIDAEAKDTSCAPVPGRPSPSTVLEDVERVGGLPWPVTLACFLHSLAKPLELNATESLISAQPAVGRRSPRSFTFVSISFDGVGSRLLEMGELRAGGTRALRAEIEFPVSGGLSREAPFERILVLDHHTMCGACHADEQPAPDVTFTRAFESRPLRPVERERVSLESLARELVDCNAAREPERCAMLDAVFRSGAVIDREFPSNVATFY
jgi:hypothetical protein